MSRNDGKNPLSYEFCGIKLNIYEPGWKLHRRKRYADVAEPDKWRLMHSHFTFEAFFVAEDRLTIATEQETRIYERKIVIVPPKLRHTTYARILTGVCLLFTFDKRQAESDQRVIEIINTLSGGLRSYELGDDTAFYVHELMAIAENDSTVVQKKAEFLTGLLFCRLMELVLPQDSHRQLKSNGSKHINAIEAFINANMGIELTPSTVADNVFLSVRQLSRIIAREYGCTVRQFIVEKKLSAAQLLVKNTDYKISEIASMVAIGSDNHFYTLFKNRYGMSPLQYRKAEKSKRQCAAKTEQLDKLIDTTKPGIE